MLPQEIIRLKRDGQPLSPAQITEFIEGVTGGTVTEGQVASFCMAVLLKGMRMDERVALTRAMARSGTLLEWKSLNLPGPVLDKHSTGGVGDKTSLVLAPLVAACGGFVPMLSGRGLGHTGGTLDKFDSIPGYQTQPALDLFRSVVRTAGCAIIGQTADLAPADKRIYAIRDTTATVESLDLITASILSKKLAAGLDALVMDVKFGSGAFMAEYSKARELAGSIATVATDAGVRTTALLTDMNQVLGHSAGNAVEMRECIDWLKDGRAETRLMELTYRLSAELLVLGGLAPDIAAGMKKCEQAIASGAAAERFARMVAALGGPADLLERPDHYLPRAPIQLAVEPERSGIIAAMDVRSIGLAIVEMGGGRARPSDTVDHGVGFTRFAQLGQTVGPGAPLAIVHARNEAQAQTAAAQVLLAVRLGEAPAAAPVVKESVAA
jgi:thymidine phosphorylase